MEEDLGINFTALDVDTTVFTNQMSVVLDTIEDSITENDTMSIPTIDGISNSRIFNVVVDQMLARNSGVKKVKIAKADIPFNSKAEEKLGDRSDIQVAPSNITVSFTDYVPAENKDTAAFYCPIGQVDDYIEVVINEITYRVTKTGTSTFGFKRGTGSTSSYDEGDSFTIDGYTFVFGSLLITDDSQDEDPNAEESTTVYPFIPCFREGTQILTKDGYISVEHLDASKHTLVDDHGRDLILLKTKRFTKPYDGKSFPYVVPAGSKLSEDFQCTQDLHVTYNHCIYLPHMNKYMPPWKMNMPQDRRKVSGYVFYHVYTENYFADVIMANGIPCETISDPVMETKIMNPSYPPELKQEILQKVMKACDFNPSDCSRTRMTRKQFNKLVYKIKSKWNKQSKMTH